MAISKTLKKEDLDIEPSKYTISSAPRADNKLQQNFI